MPDTHPRQSLYFCSISPNSKFAGSALRRLFFTCKTRFAYVAHATTYLRNGLCLKGQIVFNSVQTFAFMAAGVAWVPCLISLHSLSGQWTLLHGVNDTMEP